MKLLSPSIVALGALSLLGANAARAGEAPAPLRAAAVKGKVTFDGEKPQTKPLDIDPEKSKGCTHEGAAVDTTDRSLLVDENGGVANAVILFQVSGAKVEPPAEPIELDQEGCRFEPHVMVIPAGSRVAFLNSDSISHNVHTYPKKNTPMNKIIAAGSKEVQTYEKEDTIEIKCDIHPWMNSFLVVADTPHHAISRPDGSFSIEGLPPGEHKFEVWHEKLGKDKGTVVVKDDGTAEPIAIKLGMEKKGGGRRR